MSDIGVSNEGLEKFRDNRLDIMRAIGTLLVMFAHMGLPNDILNIRTFDVIMLVMISGMSFAYNPPKNYFKYIIKRIKKLVLPTYLVITIIFIGSYIVCSVLGRNQLYDISKIIKSYLFMDGIGYIWITKVYLMLAVILPLVYKIIKKNRNNNMFIVSILICYCIYDFGLVEIFGENLMFQEYILYAISYSIIACIGIKMVYDRKFVEKLIIISAIAFTVFQISFILKGYGFIPNEFKYPPTAYYLIYGVFISSIMYKLLPNKKIGFISWISKNSFSIYLVHIIFIMGINVMLDIIKVDIPYIWIFKYALVIFFSMGYVYIYEKVKQNIFSNKMTVELK